MRVPRLTVQEQLHEPHAALDQPAGDQAAGAIFAASPDRRGHRVFASPRFPGRCRAPPWPPIASWPPARSRRCGLPDRPRPDGHLRCRRLSACEQGQVLLLRHCRAAGPGGSRFTIRGSARPQHRSLKHRRHETAGPVRRPVDGQPARIGQHDIGRQFLRLAAQAIDHPRAERRPAERRRECRRGNSGSKLRGRCGRCASSGRRRCRRRFRRCGAAARKLRCPHWPCFSNLKGLANSLRLATLTKLNLTSPSYVWPSSRVSSGLGSNRSTCDGPPCMNSEIIALACGGKWGGRGRRSWAGGSCGLAGASASSFCSPSSQARPRRRCPAPGWPETRAAIAGWVGMQQPLPALPVHRESVATRARMPQVCEHSLRIGLLSRSRYI